MDVKDAILKRRSCRKFIDRRIPRSILLDLIRAGTYAPTGYNSQNFRFLLIDNKEEIERLGNIKAPHRITKAAAAWIVVFCDDEAHSGFAESERHIWSQIWYHNCAAAIQNILLLATKYQVGTCWISSVRDMDKTRLLHGSTWRELFSEYNVPDTYSPHGIVLLGYTNKVDKDGYPIGDERHGRSPVARRPVEYYMIGKKK